MRFAQVIELRTSRWEEVEELDREWAAQTEGIRPHSVFFAGADRDRPDTYMVVVLFDSYEDARRNNDMAETNELAVKIAALCDDPPTFRNLDVTLERP